MTTCPVCGTVGSHWRFECLEAALAREKATADRRGKLLVDAHEVILDLLDQHGASNHCECAACEAGRRMAGDRTGEYRPVPRIRAELANGVAGSAGPAAQKGSEHG